MATMRCVAVSKYLSSENRTTYSIMARSKLRNLASEFDDFKRTVGPIVFPAHNEVALLGGVALVAEVTAPELELDPYALPLVASTVDAPLGFAIGVGVVNRLDEKAEVVADHAEQEDDTLLVDWRVLEAAEVNWCAEFGAGGLGPFGRYGYARGHGWGGRDSNLVAGASLQFDKHG